MSEAVPLEEFEQMKFVMWLEDHGYKFTAIPNSTFTRSWKQKLHNKAMGLRAGFPDMVVIVGDQLVAIEMKRRKGGAVPAEQAEWISALNDAGVMAQVCKGYDEAVTFITEVAKAQAERSKPDDDLWPERRAA